MATYKFTGTITVYDVKSKADAINALRVMLNDYDDMNPDDGKQVLIHWDSVERVKAN